MKYKIDENILLSEMWEECKYWNKHTGYSKSAADNVFKKILIILKFLLKNIAIYIAGEKKWKIGGEKKLKLLILGISLTRNQKKALQGWFEINNNCVEITNNKKDAIRIPWGRLSWICLMQLPVVIRGLLKNKELERSLPWINEYARYVAGRRIASELFDRIETKSIMLTNDHSGINRALLKEAKLRNIKTIYTQHAQIGNEFPGLDFDLALLDGVQAAAQYRGSGPINGIVVLTGRQEIKRSYEKSTYGLQSIGVGVNNDDSIFKWVKIIKILKKKNAKIILRIHPADKRKMIWMIFSKLLKIDLLNSSLNDFLLSIDLLVSGRSGLILDANLYQVPCLSIIENKNDISKSSLMVDYYGYNKFNLTREVTDLHKINYEIPKIIAEACFDAAEYYEVGFFVDPKIEKVKIIKEFLKTIEHKRKFRIQNYVESHDVLRGVELHYPEKYAGTIQRYKHNFGASSQMISGE